MFNKIREKGVKYFLKAFLKFFVVFVLGLILGGWGTGYYVNQIWSRHFASWIQLDIAHDISLLQDYRNKTADRFFEVIENGIPDHVQMIAQNEEMRKSDGKMVLQKAREFYLCTKTPVPKEIEKIIEDVELADDFNCYLGEEDVDAPGDK